MQHGPTTGNDIWLLSLKEPRTAQPFLQTPSEESAPAFSPDGRYLAYVSDQSGNYEVYVQALRVDGGKWQISSGGGREPVWNPNGHELFFRSLDGEQLMAVDVSTKPTFSSGKPHLLFEGRYWSDFLIQAYDVSRDGQTFLMVKESDGVTDDTQINVIVNWAEELRQKTK